MRYHIVGVGGVGGYFGGLLAHAGVDVTFVARGEHFRTMGEFGLRVRSVAGDFHVPQPQVVDSLGKIRDAEVILVFVKTYHTAEVAEELGRNVDPATTIVTFQTGLENDLEILKSVPTRRVFPGLAYINAAKTGPGQIEQTSGPCTLTFGARNGLRDPVLEQMQQQLRDVGIGATLSDTIEREMWNKLVWISAFAGTTALFRSKIGPIVNLPQGYEIFRRCLDEGLLMADRRGIDLDDGMKKKLFEKIEYYKSDGRDAKTSLLLDMEHGRRTEVETIHGTLVRYAQQDGIDVPLLQTIYAIVKLHDRQVTAAANA